MASHLARFNELSGYDALVPVPLHPERLCERGYNQAGILAQELGLATGLPVKALLERPKATKPQWDLDREARRKNLSGAFTAKPQARGLSLLIIDDICTSGSSLEECGRALHRAGSPRVAAFVFARQTLATPD
jgi:ComF family protein